MQELRKFPNYGKNIFEWCSQKTNSVCSAENLGRTKSQTCFGRKFIKIQKKLGSQVELFFTGVLKYDVFCDQRRVSTVFHRKNLWSPNFFPSVGLKCLIDNLRNVLFRCYRNNLSGVFFETFYRNRNF